jgi:hypothetical protein
MGDCGGGETRKCRYNLETNASRLGSHPATANVASRNKSSFSHDSEPISSASDYNYKSKASSTISDRTSRDDDSRCAFDYPTPAAKKPIGATTFYRSHFHGQRHCGPY